MRDPSVISQLMLGKEPSLSLMPSKSVLNADEEQFMMHLKHVDQLRTMKKDLDLAFLWAEPLVKKVTKKGEEVYKAINLPLEFEREFEEVVSVVK